MKPAVCPNLAELQQGWKRKDQQAVRHVAACRHCRQVLLVSASIGSMESLAGPSPSVASHLWRSQFLDRLRRETLATLPITVMYSVGVIVSSAFLLLIAEQRRLFDFSEWRKVVPDWISLGGSGPYLLGALALGCLLARILRAEEE